MEVIAPLRVEGVAAGFWCSYDARIIQIALGDQEQFSSQLRLKYARLGRQLFKKMNRRHVENLMHRVEAQCIEAIVAQHHERVITEIAAHFVAARTVEIDGAPPRGRISIGVVVAKSIEVVTQWSEVVVDDVSDDR